MAAIVGISADEDDAANAAQNSAANRPSRTRTRRTRDQRSAAQASRATWPRRQAHATFCRWCGSDVSLDNYKALCKRQGQGWMVERAATGGKPVPQAISDYAAAVRDASNTMESDPPADYRADKHWPDPPKTG